MAEFCNVCANRLFGANVKPEIDIDSIASELTPEHYITVLCEGCAMVAVEKDANGNIFLITSSNENSQDKYNFHSYEEWQEGQLFEKYN